MNELERLQDWYCSRCDGDWEHDPGFSIEVIDNPGWMIRLRILENELVNIAAHDFTENRSGSDWISIRMTNGYLQIACGPRNLVEALDRFLKIVS